MMTGMICDCGHSWLLHNPEPYSGCCGQVKGFCCYCPKQRPASLNLITFALPSMPVSVNSLYEIWYSTREVKLKKECLSWKTRAKEFMPPWKLQSESSFIRVDATFYYDFHYKNGKLRKVDTQNLMKLLIDAVAERYGFKDERVKRCPIDSQHSKDERAVVIVSEYTMEEKPNEV